MKKTRVKYNSEACVNWKNRKKEMIGWRKY